MKLPLLEKEEEIEENTFQDEEEEEDVLLPPKPRGQTVLLILAGLCAVLLVAVLALSLPAMLQKPQQELGGDPEAMLRPSYVEEEIELKDDPILEETTEETTEPTIPPEANPYNQFDFQYNRNNYLLCVKQDSYPGVDVSSFQGKIDWPKVAASGIRFAMVRLGYRGWGEAGNMKVDDNAVENLEGAAAAGLEVGAYFFSQATSIQEVDDEIKFALEVLGDRHLSMPIVMDWEIANPEGRTRNVDRRTLTECLRYYCETMTEKGYHPMIYFNWGQASRMIHLSELEDYPFWLALYQDRMTFPFRVEMWQYTCTGQVPGINGDVDINVFMPDTRAK